MERILSAADTYTVSLPLAYSAVIIFLHVVFKWITTSHALCFEFMSLLRPRTIFNAMKLTFVDDRNTPCSTIDVKASNTSVQQPLSAEAEMLKREDVEMVIEKLGISCNLDRDKFKDCLCSDDLSVLFADVEPSLEEVHEAFLVFDANRDGFIDAKELQRVLCNLGFREGLNLDRCEMMIRAVEKNGVDRIDFSQFVKFMEKSLW